VVNPQVVCLRLSGSFGTVLSDTDAEAWLPRRAGSAGSADSTGGSPRCRF